MSEAADIGIGVRLKTARERRHWNREMLAFHSGVSWSAISQIESGRRPHARPGTLAALAGALGVSVDYLVYGGVSRPMLDHMALLYDSDEELLEVGVPFLAEGIAHSDAMLAVTTAPNIELLTDALDTDAREIEFVERTSWLTSPAEALQGFMAYVQKKLDGGAPWVRILGEPLWEGRSEPEIRLWARFESLINLIFASAPVSILCPYDKRTVAPEITRQALATHPHTLDPTGTKVSPDFADPGEFVLEL